MNNKKGFTLIELLAVIVILAVIMVIAVPRILDVINSSKTSAADSSIKLVKEAIKTQVTTGSMSGTTFVKEGECYEFDFENNNINVQALSLKNKDKIGGSIKYCNGKFEEDTLTFDGISVSNGSNGGESEVKICKRATTLHSERCTSTNELNYCRGAGYAPYSSKGPTIIYGSLGTSGKLSSGDAFDCDVNGDGTYDSTTERFYYITDLEENSNVAVLIYYNNVSGGQPNNASKFAYVSKEDYMLAGGTEIDYGSSGNWDKGPLTAIKQLPSTSKWSNVSLTNTSRNIKDQSGTEKINNFSYSGYAARLLTVQEVNRTCNITTGSMTRGELDNCDYLLENTIFEPEDVDNYGYWLESVHSDTSSDAWHIDGTYRSVSMGGGIQISNNNSYGIRPAIEVLKININY